MDELSCYEICKWLGSYDARRCRELPCWGCYPQQSAGIGESFVHCERKQERVDMLLDGMLH